jgi:hypothetical protein
MLECFNTSSTRIVADERIVSGRARKIAPSISDKYVRKFSTPRLNIISRTISRYLRRSSITAPRSSISFKPFSYSSGPGLSTMPAPCGQSGRSRQCGRLDG